MTPTWRKAPGLRLVAWAGESCGLVFDATTGKTHLVSAEAHQLLVDLQADPSGERALQHAPEGLLSGLAQAGLLKDAANA